jgi:integrase
MSRRNHVPTYRLHKQSGQAVVTLTDGLGKRHDVLLGKHGTPESRAEYARVLAEWEASGRRLPQRSAEPSAPDLSVNELILAYLRHVQNYYVKDGAPTSEPDTIRQALRFVKKLYGHTEARGFGPLALKAVRDAMVAHPIKRKVKVIDPATGGEVWEERLDRVGLARKYVNKQVQRIRRMFAWAVEEELLPIEVHQALLRVQGLTKGKGTAREKPRVGTVPDASVEAGLPLVPPTVRAMIEVQRLCGCRPQDVVGMRAIDIDMSGTIWEYRPRRYKTEHKSDDPGRERVVFLGPRAQAVLKSFLTLNVTDYLFNPTRAEQQRRAEQRLKRKTPLYASHVKYQARNKSGHKRAAIRDRYEVASYRRVIRRACLKAGIPIWCPLQLRHSAGTEIRKRFGLEASQAVLVHAELGVTQVYAEVDRETARRVMGEVG